MRYPAQDELKQTYHTDADSCSLRKWFVIDLPATDNNNKKQFNQNCKYKWICVDPFVCWGQNVVRYKVQADCVHVKVTYILHVCDW